MQPPCTTRRTRWKHSLKHLGLTAIVITAVLVLTALATLPVGATDTDPYAPSYSIQEGTTLHAFGWSYLAVQNAAKQQLESMMLTVDAHFDSALVAPLQPTATSTAGLTFADWEALYAATSYTVRTAADESCIGTAEDFAALCATSRALSSAPLHILLEVAPVAGTTDASEDDLVAYLKACIDLGADGFCFVDADTMAVSADFWTGVMDAARTYAADTRDIDLYCYASIDQSSDASPYIEAGMSVTDSYGITIRDDVIVGNLASTYPTIPFGRDLPADRLVHTIETPEEYMSGVTSGISADDLAKAWALTAPRAGNMGLFFSRPTSADAALGSSNNGWMNSTVGYVNQHNRYARGLKESLFYSDSGYAYIEHGISAVTIVQTAGTSQFFNLPCQQAVLGTYSDLISRNSITVYNTFSDGNRITGYVGSSRVAIAMIPYLGPDYYCQHVMHNTDGLCVGCKRVMDHTWVGHICTVCGVRESMESRSPAVYFDNSLFGWDEVYAYAWNSNDDQPLGAWPGTRMTAIDGEANLFVATRLGDATYVIFNNNAGIQTVDLPFAGGCSIYRCTQADLEGKYEAEVIGMHHDFSEPIADANTLCAEAGCITNTTYYYTCADACGAISDTLTFEIPDTATGHGALTATAAKPATCTADGNLAYWYCATCDTYYTDEAGTNATTLDALTIPGGHTDTDRDGRCDECGEVDTAVFVAASVSLGGDIGVNFYFDLSDQMVADPAAYVRLTLPGGGSRDIPVGDAVTATYNDRVCYVFTCHLAAKQMTDSITATAVRGDGMENLPYTYSVETYALAILNDEGRVYTTAEKDLAAAMLRYGAAAQAYFGYRTDDPADASLSDKSVPAISGATPVKDVTGATDGLTLAGTSALLKSNTTLRLYFHATADMENYTFTVNGVAATAKETTTNTGASLYYLDVADIPAAHMATVQTVTVTDGETTMTVRWNLHAYLADVSAMDEAPSRSLAAAAYAYGQAADAYAATKE